MRWIAPLLVSTTLLAGCSLFTGMDESFTGLLERSGQAQPKLTAYELGKRHLQLGNPGLAIESFQSDLAAHPNSIPALNGLAIAYDRIGRSDVAQGYLDQALALDAHSVVTLNNYAYLNLSHGNAAVALAYGERARAAASVSGEMRLPAPITAALSRNFELATALAAASEVRQMASRETFEQLEMDAGVERVGENEWRIRIPALKSEGARVQSLSPQMSPRPAASTKTWRLKLPDGTKVRVSNGTGRHLMALRFAGYLSDHGLPVRQRSNAQNFGYKQSILFYNPDQRDIALSLSQNLPFSVKLMEAKKGAGEIEIVLGADLLTFDDSLRAA